MLRYVYMYLFLYEMYEKYKIRKYGFYGILYKYVVIKVVEYLKRLFEELKFIICYFGNGLSVCVIKYGKLVDISMGFIFLVGFVMGIRSGIIDFVVIFYFMEKEKMDVK